MCDGIRGYDICKSFWMHVQPSWLSVGQWNFVVYRNVLRPEGHATYKCIYWVGGAEGNV